ncbi:MAG: hypothetical protein AAF065_08590 [Verrucomicrobiota bacterium]
MHRTTIRYYLSTIFLIAVLMITVTAAAQEAATDHRIGRFDTTKDLLLLNYDFKPDEDDIHAVAAMSCMLEHPDFKDQFNYYAVSGAYATQKKGGYIHTVTPEFFNLAFGKGTWTDAHDDWEASVLVVKDKMQATLESGGTVFVADSGPSDFTYDVVQALLGTGLSPEVVKEQVWVIQHHDWNEKNTRPERLAWLKQNTRYIRINEGNSSGPGSRGEGTPALQSNDRKWIRAATTASNPNTRARQLWRQAYQLSHDWIARSPASWHNKAIKIMHDTPDVQSDPSFPIMVGSYKRKGIRYYTCDGLAFPDLVIVWWIFEMDYVPVDTSNNSIRAFWERFVVNTPESNK